MSSEGQCNSMDLDLRSFSFNSEEGKKVFHDLFVFLLNKYSDYIASAQLVDLCSMLGLRIPVVEGDYVISHIDDRFFESGSREKIIKDYCECTLNVSDDLEFVKYLCDFFGKLEEFLRLQSVKTE